jgi:hypothetical protein
MEEMKMQKICSRVEGERPLGRARHRWEDTLKMDIKFMMWQNVAWIHVDPHRFLKRLVLVNSVMNFEFLKQREICCETKCRSVSEELLYPIDLVTY